MDSVQESSRCKQTKPSLWPTRPAGRIRDHRPVSGQGVLSPGLAWYAPRAIGTRLPGRESQKDGLGTVEREIARKGSPQPEAVPRTRHTHRTNTLMGRTHRERPLTPVDSTQSAVGKWQYCSTQHAVPEGGDTAHAHARNDTPPAWPHPVEDCTGLDTRRTHPTGTPRPGQRSRTGSGSGSGSGSILDAGRPGPPHRQHPSHHRFHCRCRCRCERAGTPAPSAPAPATHPDPRHTGLRRCQPEPRPTRRPARRHTGPSRAPPVAAD